MKTIPWEAKMLALPIASKVSGEHDEHTPQDPEFVEMVIPETTVHGIHFPEEHTGKCRCDRCMIIRIKRRRTRLWAQSKCPGCGELFSSIFTHCKKCITKGQDNEVS